MSLPRSLEELAGRRAARWIRESTRGQADNFGPDAQREQQDRAIERWGLVDTGLAWQVAHSGWRHLERHPAWSEMLAAAGDRFDVLVVGYASRFARSLEAHVDARRAFHLAGAVLLFADERILSSDDQAWEAWAREIVESESYSRRLSRRIQEGYAAKRRRLGEPGGRPPHGFRRDGRPPRLVPVVEELAVVRSAFDAAARGASDREAAAGAGLGLDRLRGILTNPIYLGRLRDGSPASVEPLVDVATWNRVQELRAARNRRGGGQAHPRTYLLPMLRCAACGRSLKGDAGRYRHPDACAEFVAARRPQRYRHALRRRGGASYDRAVYEDLVGPVLREVALSLTNADLARAAELWSAFTPGPDELALRRLEGERQRAAHDFLAHRDVARLEAQLARIDEREQALRRTDAPVLAWPHALKLLRDVPALWSDPDVADEDRRQLAVELFESVDALGGRRVTWNFRSGVQVVAGVGATGVEPTLAINRAPWLVEAVG